MKVKLFWKNAPVGNGDKNARAFEDEINAWLSESPGIKIVDIRQSSSGGSFGSSLWSVWYGPRKGSQQLAEWLASYGCTVSFVDITGANNILHLKSGLAYLGENSLVVIDALADRNEFRGYDLVRVTPNDEYAANCVRVNDHVLVAAGHPHFEATLRNLGYETMALEMSEFQKMDGGLSCLSLRF